MAPYNGSGSFTLAEAAFVPSTPISSSAMNSDLSDIATNGLTNAVTKDGQTTITAPFKGANGSVGAPMYSFASDTNTGIYRIGADNIGVSAGGTKVLDITTTGLGLIDGTVSLPAYTFASDLDSGVYRIGANNIGVGVNGAKVLDISTAGLNVVGVLSANGAAFSPLAQGAGLVNGTIAESNTGNAATFAIKTLAGADPSAGDPVYCVFRNVTAATGNYVVVTLTAALSVTISSGSTMGFTSAVAGRLSFVLFNDGGTIRLGAINCLSGTSIYPLGGFPIASSTAEGGAGGADSAHVFYTGTAVSSKAYSVVGYASYESGLATAGSWNVSPTRIQLYGSGVPLPGVLVQTQETSTGAVDTTTSAIPQDDTIPQISEGKEFMTRAITPSSASNLLEISVQAQFGVGTAATVVLALFQDAIADSLSTSSISNSGALGEVTIRKRILAGLTSSTTFRARGGTTAGTLTFNGITSGRLFGGVSNSFIEVREYMA